MLASALRQAGLLLPGAQQTPQHNELPHVIRIMVGHEQGFAQQRLPLPMRNGSEKIVGRIPDELFHFGQVPPERRHAGIPRRCVRRSIALGPVALRPLRRLMLRIAAEFKNVPLRQAQMLQKPPCREWQLFHASALQSFGQPVYRLVEIGVRPAAA